MDDSRKSGDDRMLIRVIKGSSAFSLGTMAALLYSVKQVNPALKFRFSSGTAVSFAIAAGLSWAFWRLVFGKRPGFGGTMSAARRFWLMVLCFVFVFGTAAPFVYALNDLARDKAGEIAQGTAVAVLALGILGFLFWRVTRFLNADSERNAGPGSPPRRPE